MRKRINFRKLGRTSTHKMAMLQNMVTSLIEHERIVTTVPKAKEVQSMAEKLITLSKSAQNDPIHARRQINKIVQTDMAATKLLTILGPRYTYREGGYTRVMKLSKPRAGDAADMAVIEYVDRPGEIRAARPPSIFQNCTSLDEALSKLGLEPKLLGQSKSKNQNQNTTPFPIDDDNIIDVTGTTKKPTSDSI
jgi:large subunit ribosomal protein L17